MYIYRFRNRAQYEQHQQKQSSTLETRHAALMALQNANKGNNFKIEGFSITAGKGVKFFVDWAYSDGQHINWRERIICPKTNLNNRQRACYHLYQCEMEPYEDDIVYITEQTTPFYDFLKTKIPNLIGSEFIEPSKQDEVKELDLRHEDLTQLSFESNSLDKLLSFDCLEHIPDYRSAIDECYRVLKHGGQMFCSFPFDRNRETTLVRASLLEDGTISHYTEPEYHGDPLSDQGCLSYYTFGWDILETFRNAGFTDVYAASYWSDTFGYLGHEQIVFFAKK